jgi:hypothetical protein
MPRSQSADMFLMHSAPSEDSPEGARLGGLRLERFEILLA